MKNRTDMIGVGLAGQARQSVKNQKEIFSALGWGVASYIISAGSMLEGISPFGAALCAACPQNLLIPITIGAVGGSFFPSGVPMTMKYAAAALIAAIVRWALFSGRLAKPSFAFVPVLAGCSLLLPSLMVTLAGPFTAYNLILSFAEAFLAGGAAYFFVRTLYALKLGQGVMTLKRSDTSCAIIALCIIMMSLSSFEVFHISLGRTAACLVILVCSLIGGESVGTVAGATCGAAVGLAAFPQLSFLGTYAVGGLLSGVFSPLGKFGCAAAFIMTTGAFHLMANGPRAALPYLVETAVASVVFMVIPVKMLYAAKAKLFRHLDRAGDKGIKELLLSRIGDASLALKDIAQTTQKVSQQVDKMKAGTVSEVYNKAIDTICKKCGLKTRCWQQEYTDSMNVFNHFTSVLRKNGSITPEDFVYPLSARCGKKEQIAAVVNDGYEEFISKEGMYRKVARVRSVVTDQFDGMADMLTGFGEEMLRITAYDNQMTLKIMDYLESLSLNVMSVNCYRDQDQLMFVQMYLPEFKLPRVNEEKMSKELSQICDCDFAQPEKVAYGGKVQLTFREEAEFSMEFASSQHICQGAKLCGDCCSTFTDRRSIAHMIVSDGMGSGAAAAIDSAMTVSLISKLLEANVAYEPSLKIVNSALLVKSGEESLSTIDIAAVNLYTGQVDFYKAGAAPTFVKHSGKTGHIHSTSLPVGILSAVDFEKSTLKLSPGDLVVMVSDGATAAGTEWITYTIDRFEDDDLQKLCDDIATTARLKRNDCHDDDITVVAGRMVKKT